MQDACLETKSLGKEEADMMFEEKECMDGVYWIWCWTQLWIGPVRFGYTLYLLGRLCFTLATSLT
jgi:hypothetical protein